jgi:lipid-binding SYLF domain-containing protein
MKSFMVCIAIISGFFSICVFADENKEVARIESSVAVLKDNQAIPEQKIPNSLFEKAEGVAIIPSVIKGAMGIGGRWGKGVIMVRSDSGTWSNPCFIILKGGSIGGQIGGEATDLVLIFRSKRSVEGVASGKFTLGASASVAAGPLGRNAEAATDEQLKAEIYSYAKSRGLFAGIAIEGSNISIDDDANARFYNSKDINAQAILDGKVASTPPSAAKLNQVITNISHENEQ